VGSASGIYPALVLARTRPNLALKAGAPEHGRGVLNLRGSLVGAQFFLASVLLIVTAAFYLQLAVAVGQPLGYEPENTAILNLSAGTQPITNDVVISE